MKLLAKMMFLNMFQAPATRQFHLLAQKESEGSVESSIVKKDNYFQASLHWETDLKGEKQSQIYQVNSPHDFSFTKWQIVLVPDRPDGEGTGHLALWVKMLESEREEAIVAIQARMVCHPDRDYEKNLHYLRYTKDTSCYGFPTYIPMYRLQLKKNPERLFQFSIFLTIAQPITEKIDLLAIKHLQNPLRSQLEFDAKVEYEGREIQVDSKRLSYHSILFRISFQEEKKMDITGFVDSKELARQLIGFCHHGRLIKPPDNIQNLSKLIQVADQFTVKKMLRACQSIYAKMMDTNNFLGYVDLVNRNLFEKKSGLRIIEKFLMEHYDELEEQKEFKESWANYETIYGTALTGFEL